MKFQVFESDTLDYLQIGGGPSTRKVFTDRLKAVDVKISMDGRGRFQDNIFIERLTKVKSSVFSYAGPRLLSFHHANEPGHVLFAQGT